MAVVEAIEETYPPRKDLEGRFCVEEAEDGCRVGSLASVEGEEPNNSSFICLAETSMALLNPDSASVMDLDGPYMDENEESALAEAGKTSADQDD